MKITHNVIEFKERYEKIEYKLKQETHTINQLIELTLEYSYLMDIIDEYIRPELAKKANKLLDIITSKLENLIEEKKQKLLNCEKDEILKSLIIKLKSLTIKNNL
jgi:hypothetical protein